MKFRHIFFLILITVTGILFFTNPDENSHKKFLKNKFTELYKQKAQEELNKTADSNLKFLGNFGKNLLPILGNE